MTFLSRKVIACKRTSVSPNFPNTHPFANASNPASWLLPQYSIVPNKFCYCNWNQSDNRIINCSKPSFLKDNKNTSCPVSYQRSTLPWANTSMKLLPRKNSKIQIRKLSWNVSMSLKNSLNSIKNSNSNLINLSHHSKVKIKTKNQVTNQWFQWTKNKWKYIPFLFN
jgi:hypothetical protein